MWPESAEGGRQRWRGVQRCLSAHAWSSRPSAASVPRASSLRPCAGRGEASRRVLCRAVGEVTDICHPALRSPREVQRLTLRREPSGPLGLHARRSSALARRAQGTPPPTSAVLYIARQVAGALRAIADHAPGDFHGAAGLDRIVLTADGRVLLVESGLGPLLAAQSSAVAAEWWATIRVAVPFTARTRVRSGDRCLSTRCPRPRTAPRPAAHPVRVSRPCGAAARAAPGRPISSAIARRWARPVRVAEPGALARHERDPPRSVRWPPCARGVLVADERVRRRARGALRRAGPARPAGRSVSPMSGRRQRSTSALARWTPPRTAVVGGWGSIAVPAACRVGARHRVARTTIR